VQAPRRVADVVNGDDVGVVECGSIHFRRAVEEGIEHSRQIAHFTVSRYLRLVHD
jgi:hypothetical protein